MRGSSQSQLVTIIIGVVAVVLVGCTTSQPYSEEQYQSWISGQDQFFEDAFEGAGKVEAVGDDADTMCIWVRGLLGTPAGLTLARNTASKFFETFPKAEKIIIIVRDWDQKNIDGVHKEIYTGLFHADGSRIDVSPE